MSSTYWEESEYNYSESSESYDDEDDDEGEEEEEDEEDEEEEEQRRLRQPDNSLEDLLDVEAVFDGDGSVIVEIEASKERCEEYTKWCEAARTEARKEIAEKKKKEWRQLLIQAAKIVGAMFLVLLLFIGVVAAYSFMEKHRMRGMIFANRIEKLPLELPPGKLQLRTYMYPIHRGREGTFTPFIASSESEGRLDVVTNVTHPDFNAYYVEHPGIRDIVMITDSFFCSPVKCFYLTDANNDSFFTNSSLIYRNLTYQLVEVPLPKNVRFIAAEYCAFFGKSDCPIFVEANGTRRIASVVQRKSFGVTSYVIDTNRKHSVDGDMRASQLVSEPKRIVRWDDGRLAIFHPKDDKFTTNIDDVRTEEVVEVLQLKEEVHILLVMKENEGKTRVRIIAIDPDNKIIRRDELIIPAPSSAITALIQESTFEICHLTRSQIECFVNQE